VRIYEVVPDVNHYQSFQFDYPDADPFWKSNQWTFDCAPKASTWVPLKVNIVGPKLKRGNFFNLGSGVVVLDAHATDALRTLLEMSGELLPLTYKGEQFTVLNVADCVEALDDSKTKWVYGKSTGATIKIEQYAFHRHRLPETPLFKIPETNKSAILTIEGMKDPQDEFKPSIERFGLTGLTFKEIWNDGK
jgi:hypothetical protein